MSKEEINNSLQVADLIANYISDQITEPELQLLLAWIEELPENGIVFEKICNERNLNTVNLSFKAYDEDLALQKVKTRLGITHAEPPIGKLPKWIAAIAAVISLIVFTVYLFKNTAHLNNDKVNPTISSNVIEPGRNKATLILDNGKRITLSEAKKGVLIDAAQVKYSDGSKVSTFDKTTPMTISTPRGGTYQITLADGTRVWLNASSSLTYVPALTVNGERRVKLDGEAYFEVAKDKLHPFVVESTGQKVRVLGTHFNINAYSDEKDTKTTLVEGRIDVNNVILKPNQQSIMSDHSNRLEVKEVDPSLAIAWKEGEFKCRRESLESLLRKVARWYDVDVVYENETAKQQTFSGTLSRADDFQKVLKRIALTGEANFKIEGRKVIVIR
ncbi:FecR family protein [Pedobacter foliorum]|uniref:FecR family protein n=1 Tax=Pedobacter foliorum TaxID=2739058 RepID=UPI0015641D09|nr:FecR domain-containing protein [Pedobacter foliorum]NRF41976.1 DUF4974 domain-containing protein [Pedobacter foliorum]